MNEKTQIKLYMIFIILIAMVMLYAAVAILPDLVDFSVETYREIAYLARPVNIIVLISSIPFFIVLVQTLLLCKDILSDDIYTKKPLNSLNVISIASLVIFVLYIILLLLFIINNYFTPLLGVILFLVILSSFIITIFSKIMYILVKKATILKEDNDLTIWGEIWF